MSDLGALQSARGPLCHLSDCRRPLPLWVAAFPWYPMRGDTALCIFLLGVLRLSPPLFPPPSCALLERCTVAAYRGNGLWGCVSHLCARRVSSARVPSGNMVRRGAHAAGPALLTWRARTGRTPDAWRPCQRQDDASSCQLLIDLRCAVPALSMAA